MKTDRLVVKALAVWLLFSVDGRAAAPEGKVGTFFIVGMGTSPDLVTRRAVSVIESCQALIVEDQRDRETWREYVGEREVWIWSHELRRYYGLDPESIRDADVRARAEENARRRSELIGRTLTALRAGKNVASLQWGDPMMFGNTLFLELLPAGTPSEIVPGIGAFQAAAAAVKMGPAYGGDTSGVILSAADWPGRLDTNEKLMRAGSSMIFYTMGLDYTVLFAQLGEAYPAQTPVAVVSYAGDRARQRVIRSTVGSFLREVRPQELPAELHMLLVGKFLEAGQARKDGLVPNP